MIDDPFAPPTPSGRRGPPLWVWAGIGCGGLLLVTVVVMVGGTLWLERAQHDPKAQALLLRALALKRGERILAIDEEARIVTVRRRDGDTVRIDYSDLGQRRLKMRSSGGHEAVMDQLSTEEVRATVPGWLPLHPGLEHTGMTGIFDRGAGGMIDFRSSLPPDSLLIWYERELKRQGFSIGSMTVRRNDQVRGSGLEASARDGRRVGLKIVRKESSWRVTLFFSETSP